MQTHAWIRLKLGTQNGHIKVNLSSYFGVNPIKFSRVMTNCLHKTRLICCHTYKVNHCKGQVKTWHVDGVTIVGVHFCGFKWIEKKNLSVKANPTCAKIMQLIFMNKNLLVFMRTMQTVKWELVCSWITHQRKSLQQYRRIWMKHWNETQLPVHQDTLIE